MALLIIGLLISIAAGSAFMMFSANVRVLNANIQSRQDLPETERYRPMLRLLSDADLDFASRSPVLRRRIRARRRELFRGYLRCLTKDYARLLSGLRQVMVESGVDRPDLAKALAKNRMLFAIALCRIEVRLQLHRVGVASVDVSGLVEALDSLRGVVNVMTPAHGAAF